jgi:hypothetical protein
MCHSHSRKARKGQGWPGSGNKRGRSILKPSRNLTITHKFLQMADRSIKEWTIDHRKHLIL